MLYFFLIKSQGLDQTLNTLRVPGIPDATLAFTRMDFSPLQDLPGPASKSLGFQIQQQTKDKNSDCFTLISRSQSAPTKTASPHKLVKDLRQRYQMYFIISSQEKIHIPNTPIRRSERELNVAPSTPSADCRSPLFYEELRKTTNQKQICLRY